MDLAGAEKENKTGNQGTRLLESNFINNTSMVFGQCLRSLLEHQKNQTPILLVNKVFEGVSGRQEEDDVGIAIHKNKVKTSQEAKPSISSSRAA